MARTRYVHPVDMVAHLWAHKSQDSARNPCHNFYFNGDTIYSYGSHFPIARHVTRKGKSAVLFTTRSYSSTTAGHKCTVESACRHLTVFHVADVTGSDCRKQFAQYRAEYMGLVGKYAKARQRKPEHLDALRRLVEEANGYAAFFGLRARLTLPDDLTGMVAECQAIEKRERERKQREERKREREAQERLQKWVDGETDYRAERIRSTYPVAYRGGRIADFAQRAGSPCHMPSRLSGFSSACTIRGKPISATVTQSTSDTSPLIPLTLKGT